MPQRMNGGLAVAGRVLAAEVLQRRDFLASWATGGLTGRVLARRVRLEASARPALRSGPCVRRPQVRRADDVAHNPMR